MKITNSWDALSEECGRLRKLNIVLVASVLLLSGLCYLSLNPDPLIVERNSRGYQTLSASKLKLSEKDIFLFLRLAIPARFDSRIEHPDDFLSEDQSKLRLSEQLELEKSGMSQTLIVRNMRVDGEQMVVEADRLISVKDIRSAFKVSLKVMIGSGPSTQDNPFGLKIQNVEVLKSGDKSL